jgi:short-subunit dehydrogenase
MWLELLFALPFLTFLIPYFIHTFLLKEQNLKVKYNAKWALVTGASSGIGRAISEKLAKQGINVVLVALKDQLLTDVHELLTKQYPNLQFRAIGVDLTQDTYMEPIKEATKDIDIQLLFNNAGFVTIGFFSDLTLQRQMGNIECNMLAGVKLTHHFLNNMLEKKLKGAIVFTSSPAGQFVTPFSVVYGATKSFVTAFATNLAPEIYWQGIDVQVLHPSPVDTNFYKGDTQHKSQNLALFWKTAVSPQVIAETMFATLGRFGVVREQGYFVLFKVLMHLIDVHFMAWIATYAAVIAPEYKTLMAERQKRK